MPAESFVLFQYEALMGHGVSVKLGTLVLVIILSHLSEISFLIFLYWIHLD